MIPCAIAVGILFGCAPRSPQPFGPAVIFVGSLQSETLSRQPTDEPPRSDGSTPSSGRFKVVVRGNNCGFGEAEFKVDKVLAGTFSDERGVLRYGIGEWCQPKFWNAERRSLICVYNVGEGKHRFHSERIYETEGGDVILLRNLKRIGPIELASFLKPLPKGIYYGQVSQLPKDDIDDVLAQGFLTLDDGDLFAVQGVFLTDLAQALDDMSWRPQRIATLVPDGLGGYVEIAESERDRLDMSAIVAGESDQRREIWDC